MIKIEAEDTLNNILSSLESCPICKGKAEILAMHTTSKGIIIDSIGCRKCHLSIEREWRCAESIKPFAKRPKTIVNPVHIWNQRCSAISD